MRHQSIETASDFALDSASDSVLDSDSEQLADPISVGEDSVA